MDPYWLFWVALSQITSTQGLLPPIPSIQSRLKPKLYQQMVAEREILTHAQLDTAAGRYSFYSAMRVAAGLERTRRALTDYQVYAKLVPYIDRATYSPITRVLDIEGGVWRFVLHSWVRFDERADPPPGSASVHYEIVQGHFKGLSGDILFESAGEKGTVVYFGGEARGSHWPPQFVIEQGAKIVFGFTAARMRKYVETEAKEEPTPHDKTLPKPRSRL